MEGFEALPNSEKARLLWEEGTYLESIDDDVYRANLYFLHNEYVEVSIRKVTNEIAQIKTLQGDELNPYLNHIDLGL